MIKHSTTWLLCAVFLLTGATVAFGQEWKTYTNSSQINDLVYNDSEVWAGTGGGVLRFYPDGSNVIKYTNSEGLGDNIITCVVEGGGYIWAGSDSGKLSRFDPETSEWRIFVLTDRDGSSICINDIKQSGDFLWIATEIGISKFDMFRNGGEVKETYRRLGDISVEMPVLSIDITNLIGDRVIATTADGIAIADLNDEFLQDPTHWSTITEDNSTDFPDENLTAATYVGMNVIELIVGTESGLYSVIYYISGDISFDLIAAEGDTINDIRIVDSTAVITANHAIYSYDIVNSPTVIATPSDDVIFRTTINVDDEWIIGTDAEGVQLGLTGENEVLVTGPPSNSIIDIDSDSHGNIWICTRMDYAAQYDSDSWTVWELPFSEGGQWGIEVDINDDVWVATWQNGAVKIDGETVTEYGPDNSSIQGVEANINYAVLRDLHEDDNGIIWCPSYLGYPNRSVSFCDPATDTWDYYSTDEGFDQNDIQAIHVVDGILWTGYLNSGVFRTEIGSNPFDHTGITSTQYTTSDFLPSDDIPVIFSDIIGTVWIGTNAGLAYYDEGIDRFIQVELPTGSGPQINALEADPRNNLWIGTSNSLVLMKADGSGFEVFTTANSRIAGNEVTSLHFDEDEFLWVGTSSGLSRLDYNLGNLVEDIEKVAAFPNPFVMPDYDNVFFTYDGVADVNIYNLAGELIRETNTSIGWNGENAAGEIVASGMYLFHIRTDDGKSHTGKIAVIRK